MARTQDPSESIIAYLSCMKAMCKRYGNIPEDVQLDIFSRNLAPFYSMQLPAVYNLQQSDEECLKLKTKKYRADSYRPPSRKLHNFVEPNFAFVSTSNDAADVNALSADVESMLVPSQSRSVTCWNCQESGHVVKVCTAT